MTIEPWKPGDPPVVVRRAEEMSRAAHQVRLARDAALAAYELPHSDPDEVLIVIFHREFPSPKNSDVMKRYTYVAHWRPEPQRWYISQDPTIRPVRPLTNWDLIRFVRPTAPAVLLDRTSTGEAHPGSGRYPIATAVWFLPTQVAR